MDENINRIEDLIPLSPRDRARAAQMLVDQRLLAEYHTDGDDQIQIELQRMLALNVKAEIQLLDTRSGGLPHWLSEKLLGGCQANTSC